MHVQGTLSGIACQSLDPRWFRTTAAHQNTWPSEMITAGFRPSCRIDRIKADAVTLTYCFLSRKSLPATDCEIDKEGIDLDRRADTSGRLCRDQGGAASEERFVDCLAGARIVQHRSAHAFHGLLGCMPGVSVLATTWNGPEGGLLAVARLIPLLSNRIPARLVLPVVIPLAHDQPFLCPDDLRSDRKAGFEKALGDDGRAQRAVPT